MDLVGAYGQENFTEYMRETLAELLVTDKLEKAIQEMPQVDVINSQSKTGVSLIMVDIQDCVGTHWGLTTSTIRNGEQQRE